MKQEKLVAAQLELGEAEEVHLDGWVQMTLVE